MSASGLQILASAVLVPGLLATALAQSTSGPAHGRFLGAKETVYPDWFKESFLELGEDVAEAAGDARRVMLFFHQDGCPYCNQLVERNLAQKDIVRLMRERFDVIAINMWGDREVVSTGGERYTEKTFARALDVQFTPTLVFLEEGGQPVLRINGYYPPARFKTALDYVAGRHEASGSYPDYLARTQAPVPGGPMVDEPFFSAPPYLLIRGPQSRPLAVFFEQPDCPDCRALHDHVLADPETRALVERFESVQLDMWSDTPVLTPDGQRTTAREWARALGVAYAPTLVYFDRGGREVIRHEAEFHLFHSQSMMDYVLSGAHRDQPSFQRYLSERAETIGARGVDVDISR